MKHHPFHHHSEIDIWEDEKPVPGMRFWQAFRLTLLVSLPVSGPLLWIAYRGLAG